MHNLKEIRKDFRNFFKSVQRRSININSDKIQKLDELNRDLIQKKENLEKEKKDISRTKDSKLFEKSKEISEKLIKLLLNKKIKDDLDVILSNIPNVPLLDVPDGKDENDNKEILKTGKIPNFKPKTHFEIGENLKMLDFDLAAKTTGSRFVFVKDKLALLERALSNFMLDKHIVKNGYKEVSPHL